MSASTVSSGSVLEGPYRDDWEPSLIEWLEEEASKEHERRVLYLSRVRVFRDDDYGLADT